MAIDAVEPSGYRSRERVGGAPPTCSGASDEAVGPEWTWGKRPVAYHSSSFGGQRPEATEWTDLDACLCCSDRMDRTLAKASYALVCTWSLILTALRTSMAALLVVDNVLQV